MDEWACFVCWRQVDYEGLSVTHRAVRSTNLALTESVFAMGLPSVAYFGANLYGDNPLHVAASHAKYVFYSNTSLHVFTLPNYRRFSPF